MSEKIEAKQAKSYKESNVSGLGSDADKELRVDAAKTEKAWIGCGQKEGLKIWRIEKFEVKEIPRENYGKFYDGDSYIILNTYKKEKKICWNIHFWLGKYSTQDEMGTAAYKTVELDDLLGGDPVQYREVQGYESDSFHQLFKDGIKILKGGIESGFNKIKPQDYKPKLLHIKGKTRIHVMEVPLSCESLNEGDAFVVDAGLKSYIWFGKHVGKNEKFRAAGVARDIKSERKGFKEIIRIETKEDETKEFWDILGGKGQIKTAEEGGDDLEVEGQRDHVLYQLNETDGKFSFSKIAEGEIKRSMFKSDDVFVADFGRNIFVWIGKGSSTGERKKAMIYASDYTKQNNRPAWIPLIKVTEGHEGSEFESMLTKSGKKTTLTTKTSMSKKGGPKKTVKVRAYAKNCDKKDFFGKSDPYMIIYQNDIKVYQSDVKLLTLNPMWDDFQIEIDWSSHTNVNWKIEVWDFNKVFQHAYIGEVKFKLSDVYGKKKIIEFKLENTKKKHSKKSGDFFIQID
eukprot:gene9734-2061_t